MITSWGMFMRALKFYSLIVLCIFLLPYESYANDPSQNETQVNDGSKTSNTGESTRPAPSRYSQSRKRKLEKVTDVISSYPNVSTYIQNNNMDANKMSYSDLEKVLNDMKFQSLNAVRTPNSVTSINASAQQGPSCLPQIVKVKSGLVGAIDQLRLTNSMNHNEERSISCLDLTGANNVVGQVNLRCSNSALYVLPQSSCTVGGCSTHYNGFTSTIAPNPIDDIILSRTVTTVGQNINKSCSEIYHNNNIANVRGIAQFSCTNRGWQVNSNNCEIRECDNSYSFTIPDAYIPGGRNGTITRSYNLALYSPDECVSKGVIKSVKFSFKAARCGTATPTFEVLQNESINTGSFDPNRSRYRSVSARLVGSTLTISLSQDRYGSSSNNLSICYPTVTLTLE